MTELFYQSPYEASLDEHIRLLQELQEKHPDKKIIVQADGPGGYGYLAIYAED